MDKFLDYIESNGQKLVAALQTIIAAVILLAVVILLAKNIICGEIRNPAGLLLAAAFLCLVIAISVGSYKELAETKTNKKGKI